MASYNPKWQKWGQFTDQVSSYQHRNEAVGGYWSASFAIPNRVIDIDQWLMEGLGLHIEVCDPNLEIVWEGFVNQVDATMGSLSVTRGPLLDIGNRAEILYSPLDTTATPPTQGNQTSTGQSNDTNSQARWGVIHKVLNGGGMIPATATQVLAMYMNENTEPRTTQTLGSMGGVPQVTVHCEGYVKRLGSYIYTNSAVGTTNASTKILNILAADPAGVFSIVRSNIWANTLQVALYEMDYRAAWDILKPLIVRGDANYARYVFGVYAGQFAEYRGILSSTDTVIDKRGDYLQRLDSPDQRITTVTGEIVHPWEVLPGRWLFLPDFLPGLTQPILWRRIDPRYLFVESVTYTAPMGIQIQGGRINRLTQQLEQFGLGGMS